MKTETITVDARGVLCPIPVIETKKIVDTHKDATIFTIVDNEVSRDNVTKFGQSQGYTVTNRQDDKNYYIMLVPSDNTTHESSAQTIISATGTTNTKIEATTGATTVTTTVINLSSDLTHGTDQTNTTEMTKGLNNKVLLMTKDYLGEGSEDLGRNLMKTFWLCLAESDTIPKKIYFINSSVNMVTTNSVHLDNLTKLETRGVEIAACGICLDYFNLKDQVAVGSITNMYAITEAIVGEDLVKL